MDRTDGRPTDGDPTDEGRTEGRTGADPAPRRDVLVEALLVALCAVAVVPGLLLKLAGGGRQQSTLARPELPPPVELTQVVTVAAVVGLCALLLARRARGLAAARNVAPLALGLLLWAFAVVGDLAHGTAPGPPALLLPLLLAALWVARAPVRSLAVLGVGGAATALLAIALGLFLPGAGLYVNDAGRSLVVDKGVFAGQLLSGTFTSTNNLGQFLVLCLPFVFLLPRPAHRLACAVPIAAAMLWSGSRSSLVAAVVVLAVVAVVAARRRPADRPVPRTVRVFALLTVLVCLLLPFAARQDPTALSGRGLLWRVGIAEWASSPLLGLGSRWFIEFSGTRSELGPRSAFLAFHAHNQLLHVLVTGGVVALALLLALCRHWWRGAVRAGAAAPVCVAHFCAFFVSGALELNLAVVDRHQFFATTLAPLLVVAFAPAPDGVRAAPPGGARTMPPRPAVPDPPGRAGTG